MPQCGNHTYPPGSPRLFGPDRAWHPRSCPPPRAPVRALPHEGQRLRWRPTVLPARHVPGNEGRGGCLQIEEVGIMLATPRACSSGEDACVVRGTVVTWAFE